MADPILLRLARNKIIATVLVVIVGQVLLWPDEPVRDWLQHNADWRLKFAFIAWVAVSIGMIYDSAMGLYKAMKAMPTGSRRR
jgi:hypothetical protein